jgi:predicted MFS family arabinose efflux permease
MGEMAGPLWAEQAGSGPPLVLLHGNGETHRVFDRMAPLLTPRHRLVALDSRGCGRSPRGTGPLTIARMADDVDAALAALGLAVCCAFLNVYAAQPLLPVLSAALGAAPARAAWVVSAPTFAVALASPFVGAVAERAGRRRLIVLSLLGLAVPTALAATATGLASLVAWRFLQGVAVPGVYAVGIALITEAWAGRGVARAMSALVTGNVVGGFLGRAIAGIVAAAAGWRAAFLVLAALTVAGAALCARWLPDEPRRAHPAAPPLAALRELGRRVDVRLAATFAVGFNVLFTLVATFTYVTLHLAAPPFHLGPAALSALFAVYLVGAVVTPVAGRWIDRVGPRRGLAVALGVAVAGALAATPGAAQTTDAPGGGTTMGTAPRAVREPVRRR